MPIFFTMFCMYFICLCVIVDAVYLSWYYFTWLYCYRRSLCIEAMHLFTCAPPPPASSLQAAQWTPDDASLMRVLVEGLTVGQRIGNAALLLPFPLDPERRPLQTHWDVTPPPTCFTTRQTCGAIGGEGREERGCGQTVRFSLEGS